MGMRRWKTLPWQLLHVTLDTAEACARWLWQAEHVRFLLTVTECCARGLEVGRLPLWHAEHFEAAMLRPACVLE